MHSVVISLSDAEWFFSSHIHIENSMCYGFWVESGIGSGTPPSAHPAGKELSFVLVRGTRILTA